MYGDFWQLFVKGYGGGRKAVVLVVLTISLSLLEGLNLGLLVPLVESLDSGSKGEGHWLSSAFARIFEVLGLPFGLNSILIALGVLILVISALRYLSVILTVKMNVGFGVWLSSKLMGDYLRADASYFHHESLGELTNTLINQVETARGTMAAITQMIAIVCLASAYLAVALMISPLLTAAALSIMLLVTLGMQYFIARARALGARMVHAEGELQSAAVESMAGVRFIKAFLLEQLRQADFTRKATAVGQVNYESMRNKGQAGIIQEVGLFAIIGGIVYVAVTVVGLSLAVTMTLLFVLYRLAPRVNALNDLRRSLAQSMVSLQHVKATLDETAAPKIVSGDKPFEGLQSGVELKNVWFSYDGGPPVLEDTNIYIEKGKITALVGTSGAGKSTLMDLLLRFYDPVRGSLLVDGTDLRELDLRSWRQSISIVSQDIFLFNDTIGSNIILGRPGATTEEVVQAAQQAYAHEFIQQLSKGYDTLVGDRGLNLSGGERQRIALARAILRNPQFMILDEATSSLDSESEAIIQDSIRAIRGTCTIMVVAHRMSTIQDADKIAVLEDGRIVEQGDWDSLLAEEGVFANYHRLQFRN